MNQEKDRKWSALLAEKPAHEKIRKFASAPMFGAGIVAAAGALTAAMTAAVTGMPLLHPRLSSTFDGVFAEKPLTEEQASKLLSEVMDDKLDPRRYDEEQQGAARTHIRANIGDLSQLKQSFLHAAALRKKNGDEVAARIEAIMQTPDFTQLMNEHSAVWREQQRTAQGQEVAAAVASGHAQLKAPPRASFTRNRNTVTA